MQVEFLPLATARAAVIVHAVIRNIIFDWSGTLVDDLPAVWQASNHVFRRAGVPELTLAQFRAEFCLPFKPFYDRHIPHVALARLEEWFHGHFRTAQDSVVALPHAREFLVFCRERRVRTFLLSAVPSEHFAVQQARTGLGEFLDRPYLGIWDKRKKIHGILAENKLVPHETVFIGDMQHDIETARHGGIGSCAVLTGYQNAAQLRAAQPDLIVEHLGELRALLERHGMQLKPAPPEPRAPAKSIPARTKKLAAQQSDPRPAEPPRPPAPSFPIPTVGAAIFDRAGRVLMVRTRKWSDLWGIPGGKIERGERAEVALRRELKEETNLAVTDIRFVLAQDCIHSKEFYRDEHFVLLNYTCRCPTARPRVKLNDEAQEFRWLPLRDAFKLPLNLPTKVLLRAIAGRQAAPRADRKPRPRSRQTILR